MTVWKAESQPGLCSLVLIALLCGATAGPGAEPLAGKVLTLMKRALAVRLPEKLPKHLRNHAPDGAAREYEQYQNRVPGEGFFEPEFVKGVDRELYRELRSLWSLPLTKLLEVVPYLADSYATQERNLQAMIVQFVKDVSEDAFDKPGRDRIVEAAYLKILEEAREPRDRLDILEHGMPKLRLSEDGYLGLLRLAREWGEKDRALHTAVIQAMALGRNDTKAPRAVGEYLLDVALNDPNPATRSAAVNSWQVAYLGKDFVIPKYLALLETSLARNDGETARRVMRVVGIQYKDASAIPTILSALDADDAYTQSIAITALENIVQMDQRSIPPPVQVYSIDYDHPEVEKGALDRLARAAACWKSWWEKEGRALFEASGPENEKLKAQARNVYKLQSN